MKKDIKICITGTLISSFLFTLGMFISKDEHFVRFLQENSMAVKIVPTLLVFLCACVGFLGILCFIIIIIFILWFEIYSKIADKHNSTLITAIKSELPKETEFSLNITNQNNEELNKLLYEKLKCTAVFDGNTVYIELSLPENVKLDTDDVLWFVDNFNY
ncbi:MAG: hypothetical protein HFJ48_04635 [Clostridia bacterium]|nr:hypothetical protein [Clostridia bacterium]